MKKLQQNDNYFAKQQYDFRSISEMLITSKGYGEIVINVLFFLCRIVLASQSGNNAKQNT